jgi:hypothetical protein
VEFLGPKSLVVSLKEENGDSLVLQQCTAHDKVAMARFTKAYTHLMHVGYEFSPAGTKREERGSWLLNNYQG